MEALKIQFLHRWNSAIWKMEHAGLPGFNLGKKKNIRVYMNLIPKFKKLVDIYVKNQINSDKNLNWKKKKSDLIPNVWRINLLQLEWPQRFCLKKYG